MSTLLSRLRREVGKMIVAKSAKRYEAIYGKPAIIKAHESREEKAA